MTLSPRRTWWLAFAGFAAMMALWALSMPLFSSPDEPSHVVKAAAVVRGQFLGHDQPGKKGATETFVRVPGDLVGATPPCYAGHRSASAACQSTRRQSSATVRAGTLAGHYPPLYYLLVGVGSLLAHGHAALYLMRLISVALSAAFLASAWQSMRRWSSGFAAVGLAAAATPMVLFMGAGVNPSGFEITSAICLWASLLALLAAPGVREPRVLIRLGVSGSALVLCRGLSPVWLAVIVVIAVGSAGWSAARTALRRPDVRLTVTATVVAGVLACAWILGAGGLSVQPTASRTGRTGWSAIVASFRLTSHRVTELVGGFGWLDTPAPLWTYVMWIAAVSVAVLLGVTTARRSAVTALVALMAAVLFLPVLIEASQERALGLVWQGRYTLPIAVGVPLLAARSVDLGSVGVSDVLARRLQIWLVALLVSAQYAAFSMNLTRNTVGLGLRQAAGHAVWKPPLLPPWLFLALFALAAAATGWLLLQRAPALRAGQGDQGPPGRPDRERWPAQPRTLSS